MTRTDHTTDPSHEATSPYLPAELETVARLLLQDQRVRIVPGAWWAYVPDRQEVIYPPNLLGEWPPARSLGALCHEVAEVLFSGPAAVPAFNQFARWAESQGCAARSAELLLNAVNDLRVNRLYLEQFPGSRRFLVELYRGTTLLAMDDVDQRGRERQPLPHHAFITAMIQRWSAELAGSVYRPPPDDRVRQAIEQSWPAVLHASSCRALDALLAIVERNIFPIYQNLVAASHEALQRAAAAPPEGEESPSFGENPEDAAGTEAEVEALENDSSADIEPTTPIILLDTEGTVSADEQEDHPSPPPAATGTARPIEKTDRAGWTGGIIQRFRRIGQRGRNAPTYEEFNYIEAVRRLAPQIDRVLNGSDGREGLIAILNRRRFGTLDPWRRPRRWRRGDSGEVDPDHPENLVLSPATAFLKGRRQPRDDSQKDFADVILLDISGSVVQRGYRSRKFDQLIDTMVVFCEIHERLKIPYELIAFSDHVTVLRSFDECRFESQQIDPSSAYVPKDLSYLVREMYLAEHAETREVPGLDRAIADLSEQRGLKTIFMVTDGISSDRSALAERLREIERRNQVVPRNERLMVLAFGVGLAEEEFRRSYQPEIDGQPIQCATGQLVRTVENLPAIVCESVDRRIRTA